jgi:hypothetical protein
MIINSLERTRHTAAAPRSLVALARRTPRSRERITFGRLKEGRRLSPREEFKNG